MFRRLLALATLPALLAAQPDRSEEIEPQAIEQLIRQLSSADYRRREQAALTLREIDSPALPFLKQHLQSADLELRQRARELVHIIEKAPPVRSFLGHDKGIIGLAMLPDGRQFLTASEDRTIRRWDLATGKELERYEGHTKQVWCLALAPDGRSFVSAGQDRTIRHWPLQAGAVKPHLVVTLPDSVRCLLFLPDGKRVLAGSLDTKIYVVDLASGQTVQEWTGQADSVLCMALSPDGKQVLSGGGYRDSSICVRDAKTGDVLKRLVGHVEHVCTVAFVDADHAVSAGYDHKIRLWNLKTGQVVRTFLGHERVIYGLAVTPDGKRMLSGGYDNQIRLWDIATGAELRRYQQHTDGINALAFASAGRLAVSAANDKSVLAWSVPRRLKTTP